MGVPRWLSRWRAKSPHCPGDPPSPTDTVEGIAVAATVPNPSPTREPNSGRDEVIMALSSNVEVPPKGIAVAAPVPNPSPTREPNSGRDEGRTSPTKNRRYFWAAEKKVCWENAKTMPGRDPDRWRIDPAGNPICKKLWGMAGLHGFEYDHIVPYAKRGPSTSDNCQVLQTKVNRSKNKHDFTTKDMEMASLFMRFTDEQLDLVEMSVYGDVNRPKRKCKLITKAASMIGLNPPEMICGKTQSEDCMSAPGSPQSKQ